MPTARATIPPARKETREMIPARFQRDFGARTWKAEAFHAVSSIAINGKATPTKSFIVGILTAKYPSGTSSALPEIDAKKRIVWATPMTLSAP